MEILKSFSVKLSDDLIMILTYQYHTEKNSDSENFSGQIYNKNKSIYRYIGRVFTVDEIISMTKLFLTDEFRFKDWKWPGDNMWSGKILYMNDSTNYKFGKFLQKKFNSTISWNDWLAILSGMKRDTNKKSKTFGQYNVKPINPKKMDVDDFIITENNQKISLSDIESLRSIPGKSFYKILSSKRETQAKLINN